MNDKEQEELISNETRRWWSVFGVIFLGAIGSGFWDFFLKDVCYYIIDLSVNFADGVFAGYADSLYNHIGSGKNEILLYLWPLIIVTFIIIGPWIYTIMFYRRTSENKSSLQKDTFNPLLAIKFLRIFYPVVSLATTIMYGSILFNSLYSRQAVIYIERSTEILRPYITQDNYIKLRSEYRSIETRDQFSTLYFKIIDIGKERKIKLPDFEPLLIKK